MPGKYTVMYRRGSEQIKLCKIIFGADGSYYVTCPYHPHATAFVFKAEVRFADTVSVLRFDEVADLALLDDDNQRLKLSHHPDGFVQFSGQGIVSGRDASGRAKGVGTNSWPLLNPSEGPAFSLVMLGIDGYATADATGDSAVVFDADDVEHFDGRLVLTLEGYWIPPHWRRFIRRHADGLKLSLVHPSRAIIDLRVALAPLSSAIPGGLGLELYALPADPTVEDGFFLSGPTGDLRYDAEEFLRGDGIFATYPRSDPGDTVVRSLNFSMNAPPYRLPSVPGDASADG